MAKKYEDMTVDELDAETVRIKAEQPAKMRETLLAIRAVRDSKVAAERGRDRVRSILISQGHTVEDADQIMTEKGDKWVADAVEMFSGIKVGTTVEPDAATVSAKGQ